MTEAVIETKSRSPLDEIVVKTPESSNEKTRRWLCGINEKALPGLERLDLQIRVGPACFSKHTFVWEGAGKEAVQIEIKGSVCVLTDRQVEEIQGKLKYRYVRPIYNHGVLVGIPDIDASDSGGVHVDPVTKEETPRPPRERIGKTVAGDLPLKDILTMEVVYTDKEVRGRVVTLEQAREIVAAAEAEVNRHLESVDATFETGKGGKKKAEKDEKGDAALKAMSSERPSVAGAPAVESTGFAGSTRVAGGKSVSGGAGRLPEK